ncbi:ComEC/Rec2 family competence protein [Basfia succiniciproducens]|uniref:Metal-dependent hydrolase, beta-lactamase superfamily II n=1 Tax=Basfia succiniciproducens TaxID=653940 RepID=A0A1G5E9R6_9PAST|nr:MBL fold metallo-hydrolase [Basfia succiniciproducens]QIM69279.1 competence protein ComEC [Basfia succiniciproducens]SCY23460.1 Metal-dependent hydrolase, beta-lactamase superfamily II [Basfia succiniciproducens]
MSDFFEIDFLAVEAKKSGDAITIRYSIDGNETIHVVDGGFEATGNSIIAHIKEYYGQSRTVNIDRVIVTHQDLDHTMGLRTVLEECNVRELWMLRPWEYSSLLIDRFKRWSNVDSLSKKLKEIYPNLLALEEIANNKGIPIYEPFQGAQIGEFQVLAPSKYRYLELVADSEKTPDTITESIESASTGILSSIWDSAISFIKAAWGDENLSDKSTSRENEMSIVQYASLNNQNILLTGDAGVETLSEAVTYLKEINGGIMPKIHRFQVPHHGSRRNLSSELLDSLFGEKLSFPSSEDKFIAIISSAKEDKNHPRKAIIRALKHRGAKVVATEGVTICTFSSNMPSRSGWSSVTPLEYPEEQEE